MNNKETIQDFIDSTPLWLKTMGQQTELSGIEGCPYCGIEQEKIAKLRLAVIELQEKAWKYDELSK